MANYFDVKRELKKIYERGVGAIRKLDARYITNLLSILNTLKEDISKDDDINSMGKQILRKEIAYLSFLLPSKLEKAMKNEQKSSQHTSKRNEDNSSDNKPKPI